MQAVEFFKPFSSVLNPPKEEKAKETLLKSWHEEPKGNDAEVRLVEFGGMGTVTVLGDGLAVILNRAQLHKLHKYEQGMHLTLSSAHEMKPHSGLYLVTCDNTNQDKR